MKQEASINGTSKLDHYKWTTKGKPGKLQYIKKELIHVNPEYQREADSGKVLSLARKWSWIGCGAISVSFRNGIYWAMDGQHRVLAALKRSDIDVLPCVVFETESLTEEAIGFLDLNTNRKAVAATAKHKAMAVSGDYLAALVQSKIDECGLHVGGGGKSIGSIRCVAACRRMAGQDSDAFSVSLELAAEMALSEKSSVHERVLEGLFYLHRNLDGCNLRQASLQARIKKIGSQLLLQGANRAAAYYTTGGAKVWANGILDVINHGLRKKYELST